MSEQKLLENLLTVRELLEKLFNGGSFRFQHKKKQVIQQSSAFLWSYCDFYRSLGIKNVICFLFFFFLAAFKKAISNS